MIENTNGRGRGSEAGKTPGCCVVKSPEYVAGHIRTVLKNGGSAPHTSEVQRFFKHEVKSRGWYTGELRKVAVRFRRTILAEHGLAYLLQVADRLFRGEVLEEKTFAVMLLEGMTPQFGRAEFKLFESWLDRVSSWADHDALVHYLIGPMIAADDVFLSRPPHWAKKKSRWHQRAAAVSLIHSTRQHKNFADIRRITEMLLTSDDDMVQKGLGWLLREAAKANPDQTVRYLMAIHERTPRLVLRTACETLPANLRESVMKKKLTTETQRHRVKAPNA
jgi:3-methyladenine DNA glycosylase AlkD